MSLDGPWVDASSRRGLLIDTNLLVLFVVGSVNRSRIEGFKRTSKYSEHNYELLLRVVERFSRL
jgi:hypothetical protein